MMLVRPEFSQKLLGIEKNGKHQLIGMIGISAPYGHWPTRYPLLFSIFKGIPTEQRLPNTFIRPGLPPSLLIQGMLDVIVWPQNAILFGKELIAAGNSSKVVMRPFQDHMTTVPLTGLIPGSLNTIDDMENFVKSI